MWYLAFHSPPYGGQVGGGNAGVVLFICLYMLNINIKVSIINVKVVCFVDAFRRNFMNCELNRI